MEPLIILLFLVAAGLGWRWWSRRPADAPDAAPRCGNPACGYPVKGAETLRCSECGSDFRAVGIATPALRRGTSAMTVLIVWSICVFIAGAYLLPLMSRMGLQSTAFSYKESRTTNPAASPLTTGYAIDGRANWWGLTSPPPAMQFPVDTLGIFYVERDGARISMHLTPSRTDVVSIVADDVMIETLDLDRESIIGAVTTRLGPLAADPAEQAALDRLVDIMLLFAEAVLFSPDAAHARNATGRSATSAVTFAVKGGSSLTRNFVHPATHGVVGTLFLIIWLVGARQILRRGG